MLHRTYDPVSCQTVCGAVRDDGSWVCDETASLSRHGAAQRVGWEVSAGGLDAAASDAQAAPHDVESNAPGS